MIQSITYGAFIEQVKRRLENDYSAVEFTVSDNEVLMYMYPAVANVMTAVANNAYAVEGIQSLPDGYYTSLKFNLSSLTKDTDTGDYQLSLPNTPIGLQSGVSMRSPVLLTGGAKSYPLIYIPGYTRTFALKLPTPSFGAFWWTAGEVLYISCPNVDLINSGWKLQVTMLASRASALTDTINLPDEAIGQVFDIVIGKLLGRIGVAKDKVIDGADKKTEA